jgi:hypothetical protein
MVDLPIMGFDDTTENLRIASMGYCQAGDIPRIEIHKANGTKIEMNVEVISDERGGLAWYGGSAGGHAIVVLSDGYSLPSEVALHNAYPNPFNPVTMIEYDLPSDLFVNLSIYDIRGRLVAELVNELQVGAVDSYKVIWNADAQSSGVYFVRLTAGDAVENQKIMLIK